MPRRFRGFLSKLERTYLEFLESIEPYGDGVSSRTAWNEEENLHNRHLDYQIRWKTRQALRELCLVFEKVGFTELQSFFNDSEVLDNLRFINQTVEYVEVQKKMIRLERETS